MARNLNPLLRQELQNLVKDPERRKLAMKALKSYVNDLDSKTLPQFLAQVSETKDVSEYTISLYEVLVRTQGIKIVPHIDNIMTNVVMTLSASAGSMALHQACAKVVTAIDRYGIDPTDHDEKKRNVIHSLCKPFSNCLIASQDSFSAGAALCLKALVESDNWRFASNEMVNELCLRVAGVLDVKGTHTHINSLMSLVMALAKQNALIVEAYARLLVHSGLRILQAGVVEGNSQKRLSAIQMVNFLLKSLDPRSVVSELGIVIERMEKCESDIMEYVKGAAYECLVTAKGIAARNSSKFKQTVSHAGSNNIRSESSLDSSFASPESQTLSSFGDNDSFQESPISTSHSSCNNGYSRRNANRKLWKQENGEVDVSLKDGILSGIAQVTTTVSDDSIESLGQFHHKKNCTNEFTGFTLEHARNGEASSPARTRSLVNTDAIKIYSTPRRLIRLVQDSFDMNSEIFHKEFKNFLSPLTGYEQNNSQSDYSDDECKVNGYTSAESEEFYIGSESVSSTEDIVLKKDDDTNTIETRDETECQQRRAKIKKRSFYRMLVWLLFMVMSVLASCMFLEKQDNGRTLVPT